MILNLSKPRKPGARQAANLDTAFLVLIFLLLFAPLAYAQSSSALRSNMAQAAGPGPGSATQRAENDNGQRLPPNVAPGEAARRATREYGGRVLNVVLEDGPGGPYYRVKLLDGGRVHVVHVEARK